MDKKSKAAEQFVILVDENGRFWDGLWDLSAISHTFHLPDYDEGYEEATSRALKKCKRKS